LPQNQKHNYIEYILTKNINSNLHHHRIISYSVGRVLNVKKKKQKKKLSRQLFFFCCIYQCKLDFQS